jgi:hypothetical protein
MLKSLLFSMFEHACLGNLPLLTYFTYELTVIYMIFWYLEIIKRTHFGLLENFELIGTIIVFGCHGLYFYARFISYPSSWTLRYLLQNSRRELSPFLQLTVLFYILNTFN